MKKCLKLSLPYTGGVEFVQNLQKIGSKLSLEGSLQLHIAEKQLRIVVCGPKDTVDKFVDLVHKEVASIGAPEIEVEPFLKDRDYRGVFRVIE